MRVSLITIASLLLSFCFSPNALAKLRVVATVPDLAAIAQAVGGSHVAVKSLATPQQDPHFVDARPHLMLALNRADLLLIMGVDLEVGWLPVLLTGARNARIQIGNPGYLDCSTVVALKDVPKIRIDRSQGDLHPGGNPHYLINPDNAARVAQAIAKRFIQLDPPQAQSYETNLAHFTKQLSSAKQRWLAALQPFSNTAFVSYHKAWVYFAAWTSLKVVGYLEPKPGLPPNPAHLLRLIQQIRRQKVPLILCKSYYPDRATQLVAQKSGATLVRTNAGTDLARGETYIKRMDRLVYAVVKALKAKKGNTK